MKTVKNMLTDVSVKDFVLHQNRTTMINIVEKFNSQSVDVTVSEFLNSTVIKPYYSKTISEMDMLVSQAGLTKEEAITLLKNAVAARQQQIKK